MKAIAILQPGPPEVLQLVERPTPTPTADEVLVAVRATAVNRADLLQRVGRYPAPSDVPADIPGLEFAGDVAACGANVRGWQVGDRVMGIVSGGAYATHLVVPHGQLLPIPVGMSYTAAAALPEAFLTAFDALILQGRLAAGEWLLIQAAASGIGTAAAQIARCYRAHAIGLTRSAHKRERLIERSLCEQVLLASGEELVATIGAATGGRGVDLVLDLVGAAAWELHLQLLAERGRIVVLGLLGGSRVPLDLSRLMTRRLTLIGSVLRARSSAEKSALTAEFRQRLYPRLQRGELFPVVDTVLPLTEAAGAHRRLEANDSFGKIVLEVLSTPK